MSPSPKPCHPVATALTRRRLLLWGGGALALAGGVLAWRRFDADMAAAERRIAGASEIVATRFGTLEYATRGTGPDVLMIHGTGGGFDQGLGLSAPLVRKGYRVIAPSRFGYLRSDFPEEPSSENQADALADLLDHLCIQRLAVAGGSAGALAAVQFALRHPDRCSALILLVPAANVTGPDPVEMTATQRFLFGHVLGSDVLFWTMRQLAPRMLVETLLATDWALLDRVSRRERARAFRILDEILPVSRRRRGILNDAKLAGSSLPVVDYRRIAAPTFLLSLEDDRFGTAATARHLASRIPDAELVILPKGGHVWLGAEETLFGHLDRFLKRVGRAA